MMPASPELDIQPMRWKEVSWRASRSKNSPGSAGWGRTRIPTWPRSRDTAATTSSMARYLPGMKSRATPKPWAQPASASRRRAWSGSWASGGRLVW